MENNSKDLDNFTEVQRLKDKVREFCEERDWDQYHGAKELAIGITTEASELLQHFRFKSEKEVEEIFSDLNKKEKITEEMADILYFLLRMSQRYDVDLTSELTKKLKKNEERYPVDKAKGSNKKYTEF